MGTYNPTEYTEWKKIVAEHLMWQGAVLLDEPVSLSVAFSRQSFDLYVSPLGIGDNKRTDMAAGDIDNLCGGIMDAANGVLWKDDRSVWNLESELRR